MEFKRVVGSRRSIRWFKPWKPVEREQDPGHSRGRQPGVALDQCRLSTGARAVQGRAEGRGHRGAAQPDHVGRPRSRAGVHLLVLRHATTSRVARIGSRSSSSTRRFRPRTAGPRSTSTRSSGRRCSVRSRRTRPPSPSWAGSRPGSRICNALNAAVDEGLGTCLHAFTAPDMIKEQFNVPDSWVPVWLQVVGYPSEEPRPAGSGRGGPSSTLFFEGSCDTRGRRTPRSRSGSRKRG